MYEKRTETFKTLYIKWGKNNIATFWKFSQEGNKILCA